MSENSGVGLLKFHCILKAETNSNKHWYSPSRTAYIDEYLQTQSLELLEPTTNVYFLTVPGQAVHVV
jgi:hypothetical protein